jgi:quercetin dioxygenase-like cupin family protein
MDQPTFEAQLKADGYTDIETKTVAPMLERESHDHDYTIRGLVLSGTFIVVGDDRNVTYRPGDIFDVPKGRVHHEKTGADGSRILIGLKY